MGPLEIRDCAALKNKFKLGEGYNRKLVTAKFTRDDFKKGFASQGPKFKPAYQRKRKFQPSGNRGKQP